MPHFNWRTRLSSTHFFAPQLVLVALVGACSSVPPPVHDDAYDLPAPEHGVQLETPEFKVDAGTEIQHCYWFKLPSDVDLEVVKFQVRYLTGSHHMNLFQTDQDFADHDDDCFKGVFSPMGTNGYNLVVGSQSGKFDWQLPEGVAFKLKAHRQLMLQTHYVNAQTQGTPAGVGKVRVNLVAATDPSKIKAHMGTMFANNVNVEIPPRSERSFTTTCTFPEDANVVAMTGHFHSRGKAFSVNLSPDGTSATDEVYRSRDWAEPPFTILPEARAVSKSSGLQYTCSFQNGGNTTIKFGPHVETDEHCNLFAYFYPWESSDARYCF